MLLSPQKTSFKKGLRGYKARQVDTYIQALCSDFADAEEDYQSRIVSLEKEIAKLREELGQTRLLQSENEQLRNQLAQLQRHYFWLKLTRKSADHAPKKEKSTRKKRKNKDAVAEKTKKFFQYSADLIRILGNTGRQVVRVVDALPAPYDQNKCKQCYSVPEATNASRSLVKRKRHNKNNGKHLRKEKK
jgi:cell division septum initiation protein DivIVA